MKKRGASDRRGYLYGGQLARRLMSGGLVYAGGICPRAIVRGGGGVCPEGDWPDTVKYVDKELGKTVICYLYTSVCLTNMGISLGSCTYIIS